MHNQITLSTEETTTSGTEPPAISASLQQTYGTSRIKRSRSFTHASADAEENPDLISTGTRNPPKRRGAIVPRSHEYLCAAEVGMEFVFGSFQLSNSKVCEEASETGGGDAGGNGTLSKVPSSNADKARRADLCQPGGSPKASTSQQQQYPSPHENDHLLKVAPESDCCDSDDD